jgi:RNA polymerase sigma factor (sigma-70 family)
MARHATARPEPIQIFRDHEEIGAWSDERLLRRFLERSGRSAEAAFAVLIDRHGSIVYRVCLDVLRGPDEAQDAAQAVFFILAKKAGSIRKPGSLGSWLHGVSLRVARRARGETIRRRAAERRKAEMIERRQAEESGPEFVDHADLHEEIDRLPDKYRQPVIMCYMQGWTQTEVAETLGWPLGTVQTRLHRGRERLRSRLSARGAGMVGLTSAGLVKSLSSPTAAPGRAWTEATARDAVRFAAGEPVAAGLAERVLTTMRDGPVMKVVTLIAVVLMLAVVGVSSTRTGADEGRGAARRGPEPGPTPKAELRAIPVPPVVAEKVETPPVLVQPAAAPVAADVPVIVPKLATSPGLAMVGVRVDDPPKGGLELFERNWVKDDARGHGGDGLGPVFNGRSCVVCHNLGGTGGAGGIDRNIEIATVTEGPIGSTGYFYGFNMDFGTGRFEYRLGNAPVAASRTDPRVLAAIHPGFADARSVVLHRFGTDPAYNAWRGSVAGQHGPVMIRMSERNPPPLFGLGLIDAIPDAVIEAAAKRKFPGSATMKGRVSRLKDGRIGRFGWKAQTATLKEFVLSAAAGEMGLEVPDRRQAADPRLPGLGGMGLDMNESECKALADYVRNLPAPVTIAAADAKESAQRKAGEEIFKTIGCAQCHLPKLGSVEGIYSDLLLHDMSPRLEDADTYAVFVGGPPNANRDEAKARAATSAREWRTPPLWGLRDSGPYLHDGRAESIEKAIALHAGQGASSARRHAELSPRRRENLAVFLKSLAAPSATR